MSQILSSLFIQDMPDLPGEERGMQMVGGQFKELRVGLDITGERVPFNYRRQSLRFFLRSKTIDLFLCYFYLK